MTSKKRARETQIPYELEEEILARLPAKSLLRFAFVNTTWYSLISEHLLNHRASGFDHVLLNLRSETTSSWMVSDPTIRNLGSVGNLNNIEDPYIVGECDGLICFLSSTRIPNFDLLKPCCKNAIHLWNPATGQRKILPQSNILVPRPDYGIVGMGFGHDPKSADYKVVRFAVYVNFLNDVDFDMEAEVYSLRTDSWRPVARVSLENPPDATCGGVCLGGFCYWIGYTYGYARASTIVSFDMCNEVFTQFHLPEQVHLCPDRGYTLPKLLVWKGSLVLVMFPSPEGLLPSLDHTSNVRLVHIWSLEVDVGGPLTIREHQDLYLDLDTIMDVDVQGPLRMDVELLCNDDLIIKLGNKGRQVSSARFKAYHISTGQIKNISLVGTYSFNTRMVGYTPSLVSLFR